ncbi:MAG: radical SAM protein [Candidatus Omnitrophica bacterium]|nr:radical SAM protein [Candidatus Omnitrophota bacterium]MDD5351984.1 radical SAM protein [Candidatus Omnitrophota bacterium]MDD5551038.1 radical SAM protein [Candidatus Omnitrophota bacterium]
MKINLIKAEKILSPTQISIAPYTINPYRGCPFGCLYCYAQENKAVKKQGLVWGEFIDIKINCLELLEQEIKNKKIERVLLGSTVECYPPQEEKFLLTQNIIKILNKNNVAATILTKSPLIKRDLDIISQFNKNKIYLTINFNSEKTKKIFEPNSSALEERLEILKEIQERDINNRVHIAPFLPYIQDIKTICCSVEKYTQEISIELYNFKMGNWPKIKKVIENNFDKKTISKIERIISTKENYESFIKQWTEEMKRIEKTLNKKLLLLAPDFNDYYRASAVYE